MSQCIARTKDLERCRNHTEPWSVFCRRHRSWWLITLIGVIVTGTTVGANITQMFGVTFTNPLNVLNTPTPTPTFTPIPFPTSIPFGNQIFDINFSKNGDGKCNDYDASRFDYDADRKLYSITPDSEGFVSVCHENDALPAQGILQTTAFPDADIDYFGYAVFFGWQGTGKKTTDACGFGVRQKDSKIEAIFIQIIGTHWNHIPIDLDASLDKNPHSIRMVLYPSGKAIGYLDGNFVAEHSFVDCASGPVGLIAYGPGQVKINFTSLKLFALP